MSDNAPHPSYTPPAIADSMPSEFSYVGYPGRPGVDRGFSGQAEEPYDSDDNDD
jgi:hypothetical protein